MKLQTHISIQSQDPKIDYNSRTVLLGSCFAENIGAKFEYFKFRSLMNPFGILFHPRAIETFLWMSTQQEKYVESDLFFHNDQWHCFDAHSRVSSPDQSKLLLNLNTALEITRKHLQSATHICITLGTAWVYRLKALDMIVANCHKIPTSEFSKELLSNEEIKQSLQNSISLIRSINASAEIIFTISPVRHLKDGLVQNNRSKSLLIAGVHEIVEVTKKTSYFPSYEITMDELRDYRFYERDMLHPNNVAIDYIWERFLDIWASEDSFQTMKKVDQIQKGLHHKPFRSDSKQYQTFLQNLQQKKEQLQEEFPFIEF